MFPKFEFHAFVKNADSISVIIRCLTGSPGEIETIGPGHELFDLARRMLEGRLAEAGWIDHNGDPINCDLDIRTMLGTKIVNDKEVFYFLLGCIWCTKGSMEGGSKFENIKSALEMEPDAEFTDVPPDPSTDDKVGRHTMDDLLGLE